MRVRLWLARLLCGKEYEVRQRVEEPAVFYARNDGEMYASSNARVYRLQNGTLSEMPSLRTDCS